MPAEGHVCRVGVRTSSRRDAGHSPIGDGAFSRRLGLLRPRTCSSIFPGAVYQNGTGEVAERPKAAVC